MNDSTLQIVLAIIGSGILTTLVSGGVTLIGKAIDKKNGVQASINELKKIVQVITKKLDEHIAKSERAKILNFQEDILKGERKTFEKFDEIIDSIEFYEKFCKENDIKNDKITLATEYIYEVYKKCKNESMLTSTSTQMIGDAELKKIIADVLAQQTKK